MSLSRWRPKIQNGPFADPANSNRFMDTQINEGLRVLNAGVECHRQGRLEEAENFYRNALASLPGNSEALHLLGLVAYQRKRFRDAQSLVGYAIGHNPSVAAYHNSLGMAQRALGLYSAAVLSYRKAIQLDSSDPEPHNNLGNALRDAGKSEEALNAYLAAIELSPDRVEGWVNAGNLAFETGDARRALDFYRQAIERDAACASAFAGLGRALRAEAQVKEALSAYERALELSPGSSDVMFNIGVALQDMGDFEGASGWFERVLEIDPRVAGAYKALGNIRAHRGECDLALKFYEQSLALKFDEGLKFRAALLLPVITHSSEDIEFHRQRFAENLRALQQRFPRLHDPVAEVGATGFYLSYHGKDNRDLLSALARTYEAACPELRWEAAHCRRPRDSSRRIRVGFISKFFHNHSIGKTSSGLIAKLDHRRFESVALFVPPVKDDDLSRFIERRADRAVLLPSNLESARERIAELELDILFYQDIGMEPFTYFLAFSRLAPVQCVSFGHPDTTGIANMDYFVSCELFEEQDAGSHYSEKLYLLRNVATPAYYYRPQPAGPVRSRLDFGLPPDVTLYICPQALFKLHPEFDLLLARLLREDLASELVLLEAKQPEWGSMLRKRFESTMPDCMPRIRFLKPQSPDDFIRLIACCDVMLDTPQFNGMNTTLEAFSQGLPVVTLPGHFQRMRHVQAMYRRIGFTECIARDESEYVTIAMRLAHEREFRARAQRAISEGAHLLYEDQAVVREFERFFDEAIAESAKGIARARAIAADALPDAAIDDGHRSN